MGKTVEDEQTSSETLYSIFAAVTVVLALFRDLLQSPRKSVAELRALALLQNEFCDDRARPCITGCVYTQPEAAQPLQSLL